MEDFKSDFPESLCRAFSEKRITRARFVADFSAWQKRHGMDFDCKGSADRSGVYVTYRGIKAVIRNGLLVWRGNAAWSVFEFCRRVDFELLQERIFEGGGGCRKTALLG